MATIIIEAGVISSQVTASNAKAQAVFTNMALLHGYDGDTGDLQAVLDFSILEIQKFLTGQSRQYASQEAIQDAAEGVEADSDIAFEN